MAKMRRMISDRGWPTSPESNTSSCVLCEQWDVIDKYIDILESGELDAWTITLLALGGEIILGERLAAMADKDLIKENLGLREDLAAANIEKMRSARAAIKMFVKLHPNAGVDYIAHDLSLDTLLIENILAELKGKQRVREMVASVEIRDEVRSVEPGQG